MLDAPFLKNGNERQSLSGTFDEKVGNFFMPNPPEFIVPDEVNHSARS
jgi:hypothetical protein